MRNLSLLKDRNDLGSWLNSEGLIRWGVEVGVAYAENAERILDQWNGETLFLVDPYITWSKEEYVDGSSVMNMKGTQDYAHNKMARFGKRANFVPHISMMALPHFDDGCLDFVYIDANHHLPMVKQDIEEWWKKVKIGGILGGHDFYDMYEENNRCEVKSVVLEFVAKNNLNLHTTLAAQLDQSWWIEKV